jgi:glucokinase
MGGKFVGFDLGGTKMLAVLFDDELKPLDELKLKTPGTNDGNEIKNLVIQTIRELLKKNEVQDAELRAIGVAVPGAVDMDKGIVLDTPNIGFRDYPLKSHLTKEFSCKVVLENDVNAGVFGEFELGACKGYKNIVGIFPGTGIGGGIIIDQKLYRGSRGSAGELGHMRVQDGGRLCGCGRFGCLETVASKTSLAKDLVALCATGSAPVIAAEAGTDFARIRSGLIRKSVKAGEKPVIALVNRLAHYLGIGMANCVNLFDPDVIILGGGLIEKLESEIVPIAEKSMRDHAQAHMVKNVKVLVSSLGDHSVATGAAALARQVG